MPKPSPHDLAPLILDGRFKFLFVEKMGWDQSQAPALKVLVDGQTYALAPVAEKKGVVILALPTLPEKNIRQQIAKIAAQSHFENLVIYHRPDFQEQIWQWPQRLVGRRTLREVVMGRKAHDLAQRLAQISIELDEEAELTLSEVTGRLARAFDMARVTRRFYTAFKAELETFTGFIQGLAETAPRAWYASLTINRLMFIYFFQKKSFLDNNPNYLGDKLAEVQAAGHKGQFQTFYRLFLRRLFHEGLGRPEGARDKKLAALLGRVPYLNGGLFEIHELEAAHAGLDIPDEAFARLFNFFDGWEWHLDDRPGRADNEINPDVLGHIFEKYINQKEMGAYYTQEDITGYISRNTILPWLWERLEPKTLKTQLWPRLQADPREYIYEAVRTGLDKPLPPGISAGLKNVAKRDGWNQAADPALALPTETWRECVARRARAEDLLARLSRGEINSVPDLITHNLDVEKLARDFLTDIDEPEVLGKVWAALTGLSVLDPTCGSGAFLFAALNILAPLYGLALEKMKDFTAAEPNPKKYEKFRAVLDELARHPNQNYFILKQIIMNNLYGLDIMKEAVEICKLRLFLKLAAQLEKAEDIEPLPDVDFNIKAGNALVGYVNRAEIEASVRDDYEAGRLAVVSPAEIEAILEKAERADMAYRRFREGQLTSRHDLELIASKAKLQNSLAELRDELDAFLARDYQVDPARKKDFAAWRESHQPFHWLAEFYGQMTKGGFDVIIGNPPYLEMREIDYRVINLKSFESNAVHAMCVERSKKTLKSVGHMSMIVPMSIVSTQRMKTVQNILEDKASVWYANFSWRPGKLFDVVNRALTIFVTHPDNNAGGRFSTGYIKWYSEYRPSLMDLITYTETISWDKYWVPKLQFPIEGAILKKMVNSKSNVADTLGHSKSPAKVYYKTTGGLYWKVFTNFPPKFIVNEKASVSSRQTYFHAKSKTEALALVAVLSSNLFWWWYTLSSTLRDLNPSDITFFPIKPELIKDESVQNLGQRYLADLKKNSSMLTRKQKQTGTTQVQSFKIQLSKPIIDEIDTVLAKHYGFTDEELDFIINYDLKYRLGGAEDEE